MIRRLIFLFSILFAFHAWGMALYIELNFDGDTYNDLDSYGAAWVESNGTTWRSTFDYRHWIHLSSSESNVVEDSGAQHRSLVLLVEDRRVSTGMTPNCYRSRFTATAVGNGTIAVLEQARGSNERCVAPPPAPPPPPVPVVCDPGHPDCGGNGTSEEPLILDLNGDGIHTTALETAPVLFDMNADGRPDLTAWSDPQTGEGFLFYDRNHNHIVDGNAELFGNRTPLSDGTIAASGVDALAAYDQRENNGNGDGEIGPGDAAWGILRVWVDREHDGVATSLETYSLGELGIESINLVFERLGPDRSYGIDAAGNFHILQGRFQQRLRGHSGKVERQIHDVFFRVTYQ